jgi:large subunit ribosomal protein L17
MVLRYHGGKQDLKASFNRGLIFALINGGKIETSKPRAREIVKMIGRIIAIAKKDNVASRRRVLADMDGDRETTARIFSVIMPRYKDRVGGYTTQVGLGRRLGDGAERVRIEWVGGAFPKEVAEEKVVKAEKVEKTKPVTKKTKTKESK